MSYDEAVRDEIFERLGTYVRWWYELDSMKETLDGLLNNAIENFNIANVAAGTDEPSEADKKAYQSFSAELHQQKDSLDSLRSSVVSMVSNFIVLNVKDLLNSPYASATDVLNELLDYMDDSDDSVEENTVSVSGVTEDEDNSVLAADGLALPTFGVPGQLTRDDQFRLVCTSDAVVDQARGPLYSGRFGQFAGQIVTGQAASWPASGITDLTVSVAPEHDEEGDTAGIAKISDWNLTGAVKGTNISEDGRVWLKFNDINVFSDENDELGQVSDWNLNSLTFGEDTDSDGNVYVSVVKEPGSCEVLGGTMAQLDASGIFIDNADETNTNNGTLYAKVTQQANTEDTWDFTVELYSNAARTQLEATRTITGVSKTADLPIEIDLVPELGGVDGQIKLEAFNSAVDGAEDNTILIKDQRYFVRVYSSVNRTTANLYAEGISYVPTTGTAGLDLYRPDADGSSDDVGDVTLNYIQDNENIVLSVSFYTIDMYKADPDGEDTTNDDIVARAGSYENLMTSVEDTINFYPVNSSGLSDVSVTLSGTDDVEADDVVSAVVGYAAGDKFTFYTSTEDNGRFQTFLRESYEKVFPSASTTNATISDDLTGA